METIHPLGKSIISGTDIAVTAISMGGAGLGGIFGEVSEADGVAAVEKALELGINWIDTSPYYFESERRIGLALRVVSRKSYHLSTKIGTNPNRYLDYSAEAAKWSVQNSLKTLGIDYLDICLIHDPLPGHLEQALGSHGALEELVKLKRQGIIRAIGIGVQSHELIHRAIDTGEMDIVLTVNDYTLLRQTVLEGVCEYAEPCGISVVNGAALAMGLLSGRDPVSIGTPRWSPAKNEVNAALRVFEWCRLRNVPILGLALQFSLRQPRLASTLIGASTAKEVEECWKAVNSPISEEIWKELNGLLEEIRVK
jgi:aryl-alcohol dehydrogenase-like predicted oxidoreductase